MDEKAELTGEEEIRLLHMVDKVIAINKYLKAKRPGTVFSDEDSVTLGLTSMHTESLVKHSITLTRLTKSLILLTIVLGILSIVQTLSILATHFNWI